MNFREARLAELRLKLSEKSRRSSKRGLVRPRSGPARAVLAPEQRPNACSEPYSNPFSDSFLRGFCEVRSVNFYEGPEFSLSFLLPLLLSHSSKVSPSGFLTLLRVCLLGMVAPSSE